MLSLLGVAMCQISKLHFQPPLQIRPMKQESKSLGGASESSLQWAELVEVAPF